MVINVLNKYATSENTFFMVLGETSPTKSNKGLKVGLLISVILLLTLLLTVVPVLIHRRKAHGDTHIDIERNAPV